MALKWDFGDGQAGPCMGLCMGRCMGGAWVHGGWWLVMWCGDDDVSWGWEKCMCTLPGLVGLDLGLGKGLDGDGGEVIGVVSRCEMENMFQY